MLPGIQLKLQCNRLFRGSLLAGSGMLAAVFAGCDAAAQVVTHRGCAVDAEILMLPECAIETRRGISYVGAPYLPLFFQPHQALAYRWLPGDGWAYFKRDGKVVVKNVANWDNGPSPFHRGLLRVVRDNKWGLSNAQGALVVPMVFDGMLEPDKMSHLWRACKGCRTVTHGEYSSFVGGDWFKLDPAGRIIGRAEAPLS